jgi:threonine/homoserine/homoserine lactone efflux protein
LRALPRAGVARRFGAPLLQALDQACGQGPDRYPWLLMPEVFEASLELAAQVETAPALLWALKAVGGLYLIYLAWCMWRDSDLPLDMRDDRLPPRTAASAFWLGVTTQLANPKPAVLFSAIFVGTVPPETPSWVVGALLLVVFLNETLWNTAVARIFSFDRSKAAYISLKTVIDRSFGGLLALLGVKIAIT